MGVTGKMLVDGLGTTIDFAEAASVKFSEVTLQPPGLTGGGAINTTGLRNVRVRTQQPKKLVSVSSSKGTVKYDPLALEDAYALQGVNQEITVTHPDGSTTVAWGWLEDFVPSENEEGNEPTADIVIEWSNENASGVETKPVTTAAP
jgi:hypothetical protein